MDVEATGTDDSGNFQVGNDFLPLRGCISLHLWYNVWGNFQVGNDYIPWEDVI